MPHVGVSQILLLGVQVGVTILESYLAVSHKAEYMYTL